MALRLDLYQFLQKRRLTSSLRNAAQTVDKLLRPLGVSTYPTNPTTVIGGASRIDTASTISFLWIFEPGQSTSRTTCVMPAL